MKRIVIATDGSPPAAKAVDGLELARDEGAEVTRSLGILRRAECGVLFVRGARDHAD